MNVLHIYKSYYPQTCGGVETFIDQLALGVKKHGVNSSVLTTTNEKTIKEFSYNNYSVISVPKTFEIASCPFSLKLLSIFKKEIEKADILHYHFPWPFLDCLHFLSPDNKPTILTYHSDVIKQKNLLKLYTPLMHQYLSSVNAIVATSDNYVKSSPVLNLYQHKTKVVPIGIDKESYPKPNEEDVNSLKKRFGERFFLFIGVLRYYKGIHTLIEAAKELDAQIVIAGSGPEEKSLKENASSNVHFWGYATEQDKVNLLEACYAFIFPSHLRSEAFGISLLEASMFHKPMITCEIGTGTTFVNKHGETGLAIQPENVNELKMAIQFLKDNQQQTLQMGKNAFNRCESLFRQDITSSSYFKIYEDLLKQ